MHVIFHDVNYVLFKLEHILKECILGNEQKKTFKKKCKGFISFLKVCLS